MKRYTIYNFDCLNELRENEAKFIMKNLHEGKYTYTQINSCQAWEINTPDYILLQSYNTIVAIISFNNIYCSGYYSNTTANHISRFARRHCLTYQDFKKVM